MMKKLFLALVILLMTVSAPTALAKSYSVDSVDIKAQLLPDGNAQVTETITMTFYGDFSRFVRDIPFTDEYFIKDIEVGEIGENGKKHKKLAAFDPKRPAGCYAVEKKDGKEVVEFYYKIIRAKETRTFEVSYFIENAVIVHNDVVELNRKFIDVGWDRINKLTVTVFLPEGTQKKDIKIWSHGPLWGRAEITGENEARYQISTLYQDTFAEVRVTAPRGLFPGALKRQSGKDALADIIAQEQKWADEANAERERIRQKIEADKSGDSSSYYSYVWMYELGAGALIAINCGYAVYLYRKRKNKYTPASSPQYYRNLPSDISPAELGKLYAQGSGKSAHYIATILDLSVEKFLELKSVSLPGSKTKPEDIRINLNPRGKNTRALLPHEATILTFIERAIAGNPAGSMADIKKYTKEYKSEARDSLNSFNNEAENLVREKGYLAKSRQGPPWGISLIYFMIAIPASLLAALEAESDLLLGLSVGQLYFCGFIGLKGKGWLSQKGTDELALWFGFKNFLKDFTLFAEKELPELVVWQKYLVYATVLGEAKALLKQLPRIYPQLANPDYMAQHEELWLLHTMSDEDNDFFTVFDNIGGEMAEVTRIAKSYDSDGGGGGGGSSGGNSGGDSGGGGRAD